MAAKKSGKTMPKISSETRLEDLLAETETELEQIEPQIEKLEKQIEKLRELKLAKQKLITLKLSIKSILSNYGENKVSEDTEFSLNKSVKGYGATLRTGSVMPEYSDYRNTATLVSVPQPLRLPGTFLPDRAFAQVNKVLRRKNSLNYELFRAIVFNGGHATTEQIKEYLIENAITQPASGEGFESVELTDISSRVNYLVRKGLVNPDGRGNFVSCLGWIIPED